MTKEKYTVEELLHLLRKKNVFNIADVEFAVLEANGDLNVMFKKEKQPITPKDLQMDVAPERPPHTVILEGKIMDSGLSASGMTREWLDVELKKRNVALDNVYIGQVDPFGQLVVDIYDDHMQVPQPKDRPMLWSALKKCGADLETFALATEDEKAKKMYSRNAKKIEEIIQKSEHLLRQ